jgi:DNA-binding NarL/FixJ family response regulator
LSFFPDVFWIEMCYDGIEQRGEVYMKRQTSAVIISRPGPLRDGLKTFLTAIPGIEVVHPVDDAPSAQEVIAEHCPALVLLDANGIDGGDGISTAVKMIKDQRTPNRFLVLVEDVRQQGEAQAAGADVVLVNGFPAARLFEVVAGLLLNE